MNPETNAASSKNGHNLNQSDQRSMALSEPEEYCATVTPRPIRNMPDMMIAMADGTRCDIVTKRSDRWQRALAK